MKSSTFDALAGNAALEIAQFAAFDHATRRFIAYAMYFVPDLVPPLAQQELTGNQPVPFVVSDAERLERLDAYGPILQLRACTATGRAGQRERRLLFGALLGMARVDLRWKRLTALSEFIYCYERLVGPAWRQLLVPCWSEAGFQRRRKGAVQLPLDGRLRDDRAVPHLLESDDPSSFFPTLADADRIGLPLLGNL
jgi:hypothetical protein